MIGVRSVSRNRLRKALSAKSEFIFDPRRSRAPVNFIEWKGQHGQLHFGKIC